MSSRGPIFDTHLHFFQVTRPGGVPWPPQNASPRLFRDVLPAEYRALARTFGITGAGIVEASPLREDNQWVLDLVRGDDLFVFLVASLDIDAPDFPQALATLAADSKVAGIRAFLWTASIDLTPRQRAHLADLAARGLTLDIISRRTTNPKDQVVALARSTPNLRIIIDHLGGALGTVPSPRWSRDIAHVAAEPNVFMKFSSFYDVYNPTGDDSQIWPSPTGIGAYRAHFDVLMNAFGPDRLIWGSNWPVVVMGGDFARQIELAEEYLMPFGPAVRHKVMHDNALGFYRNQ